MLNRLGIYSSPLEQFEVFSILFVFSNSTIYILLTIIFVLFLFYISGRQALFLVGAKNL